MFLTAVTGSVAGPADADSSPGRAGGNLLLNPTFEFHALTPHREGKPVSFSEGYVAFWNSGAYGDVTVLREAHAPDSVRPPFSTGNIVKIEPGRALRQTIFLPDASLAHGEAVVLSVHGYQDAPGALAARLKVLKLDSEDGDWQPSEAGMGDTRTFPKHSRGELVVSAEVSAAADTTGRIALATNALLIEGRVQAESRDVSRSDDINAIALEVEFANTGADKPVWVWWPTLSRGAEARWRLSAQRQPYPWYRHIPRTIQKLWKGDPVHILVMGSSIDRGSANPPMYLYDEDPESDGFKRPVSERMFDPALVGRPDLDGYVGWWQHYFGYSGRLRLELMRKFGVPVDKICLNVMACDGSCVGEAHSGLEAYTSLAIAPEPNANGHAQGRGWQDLYPGLFIRPEGPRPDLVIFGSGANEKTDTPDEVAVFEGMIRWIQRHYPDTEFIFCMFQNAGGYTPNGGDLQALSLRYQIPMLDYGLVSDQLTRWCNRYALVPRDGHPQAAAHFVWFKVLERAFECWDPILPGIVQQQLPERVHANTYGWEGDMVTLDAPHPRIRGNMVVFEDTALNCWGSVTAGTPVPWVDGIKQSSRRPSPNRDPRNSLFRHGATTLGDRHILEIEGEGAALTAVDLKVCPNREFVPVSSPRWDLGDLVAVAYASDWGAPYGDSAVEVPPGKSIMIEIPGTDISVAFVDGPQAGTLKVVTDDRPSINIPAQAPFVDRAGVEHYMENRRGIRGLPYGLHRVTLTSVDAPVMVLGIYGYDARSNRRNERIVRGMAVPGQDVHFSAPFRGRPVVVCSGELRADPSDIRTDGIRFTGAGPGIYQAIGE